MVNKLRVVHVLSSLGRKGAGVREAVVGLAKAQAANGQIWPIIVGIDDCVSLGEFNDFEGLEVFSGIHFPPRALYFSPHLEKLLHHIAPDLVHVHGLWTHPISGVYRWSVASGRPYVVSTHGMLSTVALSYSRIKKSLVQFAFHRRALSKASAYHATSFAEVDEIRDFGLTPSAVCIPNGVELPDFDRFSEPEKLIVTYFGRIHKKKGIDLLLRAWALLEIDYPHWCLRIIGPNEGGELLKLMRLRSELCLTNVTFCGAVESPKRWDVYAEAAVTVLPTRSENFGLTVAESLAAGIPVVCTKGAPWEEIDSFNCGRWVEIDHMAIYGALSDLMALAPDQRLEMGRNGRNLMENKYSWNAISRKFTDFYLNVICEN